MNYSIASKKQKLSVVFLSIAVLILLGGLALPQTTHAQELGWVDTYGDNLGWADTYGDNLGWYDSYGDNLGWADTYGDNLGWADTYGDNLGYVDTYGNNLGYADTYGDQCYECYTDEYGVQYSYRDSYSSYSTPGCSYCQPPRYSTPPGVAYNPSYPRPTPQPAPPPRPFPTPTPTSNSNTSNCVNNSCNSNTNTNINNVDNSNNSINHSFNTSVAKVTPVQTQPPHYPVQYVFPPTYTPPPTYIQPPTYLPPTPTYRPAPYVALSQIPYTGFDLGPFGNAAYLGGILVFAGALAYLVLYYKGGAAVFIPSVFGSRRSPRVARAVAVSAPANAIATPAMFAGKSAARASAPSASHRTLPNLPIAHTSGSPKDAMTTVRSEAGSAPRIVITRG